MAANNTRRRAVAWSTSSRPAGVMETCTTRRSARAAVPADEALAGQPVAHPPGRRRRHIEQPGQVHHPLQAPGRHHHQRSVLAAWSGYAAAKWSTESSLLLARAGPDRAETNTASLDAVNALNFDATTFNDWFTAYVGGNRSAMAIAEARFTPNLDAAFRAWMATGPGANPAARRGRPTYLSAVITLSKANS